MMSPVLAFIELVGPFVCALLLLGGLALPGLPGVFHIYVPIPFIGHYELEVLNVWLQRVLLLSGSGIFLAYPAFRDYTSFFPRHIPMQAFFDDDGVAATLAEFTQEERNLFHLASDWPTRKAAYFLRLNEELEKQDAGDFRFDVNSGVVHSTGQTNIEARQIHKWRQIYQFTSIQGQLKHVVDRAGRPTARIDSEFELLESGASVVNLTFANLYLAKPILVQPLFKQLMRMSQGREIYHHNLIAATRIDVFPMIDISRSIYLWTDSDGSRVPIGYALYSPE
jgi:hypothetical protein